ncbi:hypothetical protein BS47DRAFT_1376734 [Hydnum rufescens UP504]|uniref:Uncharacterized protein n=1 Tax=Hydnum rufescens UP504 TaxID=1448309 RepID=A0A9P6AWV5_9AGAM|nr:hypothetical protein BS47DRAFT_1376734 [Hydnum rufescens UP504]
MLLRFRPHNSTLGKLTLFPTAEILNSNNPSKTVPTHSDATVVGAGIHGLICPVHPRVANPEADLQISIFEKSSKLQWKIGESTLPLFAQWAKGLGLRGEYLLHLFGIKDGLEFYILDRQNPRKYKEFCNNGPPPFLLLGYQVEHSISELLLTLFTQHNGVNVWHGHQTDVQKTVLGFDGDVIPIKNVSNKSEVVTRSPLLVGGTGRFRQYSSKVSRVKHFKGFNTDAFWGYCQCEDEAHLKHFTASHTNHMCFPEGWHSLPNAMDMINYLLDHAKANSPNDEIPSALELAQMFGCSPKWVYSIGFSVRDDIVYPDLSSYGNSEGERHFRYWSKKYKKIGPQLTYQTQVVSGPGWVTVGDGIGFTNPLHSPGITSGMATGVFAADLTAAAIKVKNEEERKALWSRYDEYCANTITSLHIMNIVSSTIHLSCSPALKTFNYNCFRVPILAACVSLMWQFMVAIAPPGYTFGHIGYVLPLKKYTKYNLNWVWGSQAQTLRVGGQYFRAPFLTHILPGPRVCQGLVIPPLQARAHSLSERPSDEVIEDIIHFSEEVRIEAMAENRFPLDGTVSSEISIVNWWVFLFLSFSKEALKNKLQDVFTNVCSNCGTWAAVRGDWRKCYTCSVIRPQEECDITWNPPLVERELQVAEQKAKAEQEAMAMKEESMPMKQDSMPMKQEGMGMMK